MGDLVYPHPDEIPRGIDCPACTPAVFATGDWPSILYATFTGVTPCPGEADVPNGHHFKLLQGMAGCDYYCFETICTTDYYVELFLHLSRLRLTTVSPPYDNIFYGLEDPCTLIFPTNMFVCPLHEAEAGSAIVQESPTLLASTLCVPYSFIPPAYTHRSSSFTSIQTRSESQLVGMDHTLIRLANKSDHSRVHFYIDNEDLP